jgi:hypothetical protein
MNASIQVFDQFSLMNCSFHLWKIVLRRIQISEILYGQVQNVKTNKALALASRFVVILALQRNTKEYKLKLFYYICNSQDNA